MKMNQWLCFQVAQVTQFEQVFQNQFILVNYELFKAILGFY
jgi:hypothetical protein